MLYSFSVDDLAGGLLPNMVGSFDNALIRRTLLVRDIIDQVFEAGYLFADPNPPDLNPVERFLT